MMRIFFVSLYIKEYIKKNWFYDADNFAQYWDKNYEVVRNMITYTCQSITISKMVAIIPV